MARKNNKSGKSAAANNGRSARKGKTNGGGKSSEPKFSTVVPRAAAIQHQNIPNYRYDLTKMMEKVCSMANPFCDVARGGRWLDGLSFASCPYSSRVHFPLGTLTNSGAMIFLTPVNAPYNILTPASVAAGTYTLNALMTSSSGAMNYTTYFTGFRVVSAGFVIRNLMTVSNTSGYVIVSREAAYPAPSAPVVSGGTLNPQVMTFPIQPGMEIPIIHRPLGTVSRDFTPFATAAGTAITDPAWDVVKVEVVGAQASTIALDIELYYNYEVQLLDGSVLAATAPKTALAHPRATRLADAVASELIDVGHKSLEALGDYANKSIARALRNRLLEGSLLMD